MKILAIDRESKGVYGSPRITAELRDGGEVVTEKAVAKIMRSVGCRRDQPTYVHGPHHRGRSVRIVPSGSGAAPVRSGCLDAVWTSDITYLNCGEDDMYLCAIKDEHSKKVRGWAVADHMRSELVLDALDMAVSERGGDVTGTIMHSDKGTQYTAGIMKQACERYGLRRSTGETGILLGQRWRGS